MNFSLFSARALTFTVVKMASERSPKIQLADSVALLDAEVPEVNLFQNRLWVHEINEHRQTEEEFHALFHKLIKHPDKLYEY